MTPATTTTAPTIDLLVLGTDTQPSRMIAEALGSALVGQPVITDPALAAPAPDWDWAATLEQWRATVAQGPTAQRVVVTLLPEIGSRTPLHELGLQEWIERCEFALARWVAALGAAQQRCADGGTIIAVVDRVAPLDSSGRSAETAVSDAVEALVRSLARSEGPRRVRVNLVTTPARLTTLPVIDPQPPLAAFPGSIEEEVVATCRMLLSDDAAALTGTVLHVDAGRSWR